MAIETALTDLMIDTIIVAPLSSTDSYGKHGWGTPVSINDCRVQTGSHKITDTTGQEIVAAGLVYVPNGPTVTPESKLTLPNGSSPRILKVDSKADERGAHHIVIHYGE